MNLSDGIKLYIADRKARGMKHNTVRSEKRTLELLLADIGNIQLSNLRPQHIDVFWSRRTTWGSGTMNLAQSHLALFITWCQERGHVKRDRSPLPSRRKLRVPPRARILIPQQEFQTFLAGIEDARTRAMCAIGLYMFTRISETAELRWQDIDLYAGSAEVFRPKTQSLDTLPICEELLAEMNRWRLAYAGAIGRPVEPGDYVIPGYQQARSVGVPGMKGELVRTGSWEYLPRQKAYLTHSIRKALQEAGYYEPYEGGHTLRRSGAVALYNQLTTVGHDRAIRICQAMLGHSTIRTTEIYLRLDLDRKVRNDLLAGKPMFPDLGDAVVVPWPEAHSG